MRGKIMKSLFHVTFIEFLLQVLGWVLGNIDE